MSNIDASLQELLRLDGAMGGCIVDYTSGMSLGVAGDGVDLELAAAGNTQLVRAKMETMKSLGIKGSIDDILITLEYQFHIIRPTTTIEGLFIYLVLDKAKANLALARRKVKDIEDVLKIYVSFIAFRNSFSMKRLSKKCFGWSFVIVLF